MKREKQYGLILDIAATILLVICILLSNACSSEMNYEEYSAGVMTKEDIEKEFTYVGDLMTTIYRQLDYDYGTYGGAMMASASDESEYAVSGNAIEDFYNGAWSASNAKGSLWSTAYTAISYCNLMLDEFQNLTFSDYFYNDDYEQQLYRYHNYQWEARWARAYFYFLLVRQYGGVPLKTTTMTAEEANSLKRATADEIFQFINDECDAIKDSIVSDYTDVGEKWVSGETETGRADRLAVLALKARAALYHASPLFNSDGDSNLWHAAAQAQQELLEAAGDRKSLASTYDCLWATDNYSATQPYGEIIFGRRVGQSSTLESYNYPIGIDGGGGGNCPTQNLVDAYDMQATGLPIDDSDSGYDEANPYEGRDPRFALTIARNGDVNWPSGNSDTLQTYEGGLNGQPLTDATPTGYYLKKLLHSAINLSATSNYTSDYHTWVTFRLAEFYLNYAEAVFNWLGSADATDSEFTMSAREAASKTRLRADMPAFPEGMDNATFWKRYKNERMVELAFEGHRFWDVRRWKEADSYFSSVTEMKITLLPDGSFNYTRRQVSRQWDDKMYLFPIPQSEILKDPNLEQNPGW